MYLFLSLYLQQVAGFSPLRAGLAFLPAGLATLAGALAAPRLVAVRGSKHQLLIGPAISASGLIWITGLSPGDRYWSHILGPLVLFGLGIGTSFGPMTPAATAGVPAREAGLASGLIIRLAGQRSTQMAFTFDADPKALITERRASSSPSASPRRSWMPSRRASATTCGTTSPAAGSLSGPRPQRTQKPAGTCWSPRCASKWPSTRAWATTPTPGPTSSSCAPAWPRLRTSRCGSSAGSSTWPTTARRRPWPFTSTAAVMANGGPVDLAFDPSTVSRWPNGMVGIMGNSLHRDAPFPDPAATADGLHGFRLSAQGLLGNWGPNPTPLLVVNVADDPYVPPSDITMFQDRPNAVVRLEPGATHCAAEKAREINPWAFAWLQKQLSPQA
jgi:hypothetical protein